MVIQENMSLQRKLEILSDAAKYDVACTSSGVDRKGSQGSMGNSVACGICHSFSADGRCISLLKILFTNECIFDCKYCINRSSNDIVRASFTPQEVCELTMEFYKRNYIEGLFLSSGILVSPNYTMELILETIRLLREVHRFNGYIHCKAIPGADPVLIETLGWYTDRMSVNLELPTAESLKELAPHKNRKNILKPIRQIQLRREHNKEFIGITDNTVSSPKMITGREDNDIKEIVTTKTSLVPYQKPVGINRRYVPAGQSTQIIIGATKETDYQIMSVSQALYDNFDLKRVFYSAFMNINQDNRLPATTQGPPLLREHRLYQADWLLRFYGFHTNELLDEKNPNFNVLLDPKCDWALRHLDLFPVEVNKADYYTLLRVPGIGTNSARRIIMARKSAVLDFKDLKRLGIVLKRAVYFITCNGRTMYPIKIDENFITRQLLSIKDRLPFGIDKDITYQQLSLFDDVNFQINPSQAMKIANI
ncbi:putative DNA modification/repair radical SAM protein [Mobilitalea sibirica]|uniref:Putative DNA modification/repair radical SAM protein n=1 Tax=Mobilitalea sibirica TaxID=1462919 RepID=A0A8J7HBL5_9FIRM|nr:putative DNA modification/repair radical SAM protein [Mobilitalea sibirica]MBH1940117.1 putative DNA modification/repair radical SAM protein [Mobilitalea sibirica]